MDQPSTSLDGGGCFARGTRLLTPTGSRAIEDFRSGHVIISKPEEDSQGPLQVKIVERVYIRTGRIMNLHVGGEIIRTTAEHAFFTPKRGWVNCGELQQGEDLVSVDGSTTPVIDLIDTGRYEPVFNLTVQDSHTYFVAGQSGSLSVWSHNMNGVDCTFKGKPTKLVDRSNIRLVEMPAESTCS